MKINKLMMSHTSGLIQRSSNIELLRILAAMGVVLLHYNDGRAFKYVADSSLNKMILFLLESLCICAVDLFVIISGYFLCRSSKRSIGKIIELPLQVVLFKEAFYLEQSFFQMRSFQQKTSL